MPRILITILLLSATGALVFIGVMPQWTEIKNARAEIDRLQGIHKELVGLGEKAESLRQKYNAISEEDLQKLKAVAPAKPETSALLVDFENLALGEQMALQSVDFTPIRSAGGGQVLPEGGIYQSIPLNMSLQGPYESLVRFLKALEYNLRLVDVNEINFGSGVGGKSILDPRQVPITLRGKVYYRQ